MTVGDKILRAGVVGVGHLGRHHARHWSQIEGVKLVGVVDPDGERAAEIAERHGARVFPDVLSLAREIDIASVAAPTVHHEEATTPLLESGVATLVEKPIATTVEEGRRLVELARRKGVPLAVGHIERCQPAVIALRERVRKPRYLEIHRLAEFKPRSLDVDVVLDLMIHDIDLCQFLLGGVPVRSLDASGTPALTDRIDIASVRVRFENGAAANLTASRISVDNVRRIRVFEPGAYLSCDTTGAGRLAVFRVQRGEGGMPGVGMEQVALEPGDALNTELRLFAEAVRGRGPLPCTGEEGLRALDLALRVRDAIEAEEAGRS